MDLPARSGFRDEGTGAGTAARSLVRKRRRSRSGAGVHATVSGPRHSRRARVPASWRLAYIERWDVHRARLFGNVLSKISSRLRRLVAKVMARPDRLLDRRRRLHRGQRAVNRLQARFAGAPADPRELDQPDEITFDPAAQERPLTSLPRTSRRPYPRLSGALPADRLGSEVHPTRPHPPHGHARIRFTCHAMRIRHRTSEPVY